MTESRMSLNTLREMMYAIIPVPNNSFCYRAISDLSFESEKMTVSEGNNNGMLTIQRIHGGLDVETTIENHIDNWVASLERLLEEVPEYMYKPGHLGRISRIPDNLREVDVRAYEPYFVSIGPYHHGKPMVQSMETTKLLVLKQVLQVKPELRLTDYLNLIKNLETEARSFYSDIEMDSEKFVQILLVDSVYILKTLCGIPSSRSRVLTNDTTQMKAETDDSNDDINDDMSGENNTSRLFLTSFHHDLFLLENQLPFFVLKKLYAFVCGDSETELISIMKQKVADLLLAYAKVDLELLISPTREVHHLLHLCHMFFHPTIQQERTTGQVPESMQMFRLGNAVELHETGVRFMARSGSHHHSLLDITFSSSGKMIMPSLCVDDNTNSLLRNLIALEQMKYPSMGLDVSAYAVLLIHLVTTTKDAQLLRGEEVIQHHLGSDKNMINLVNKLSVGLSFDYVEDTYSLKPVFQELNRYSKCRVPRWKAWLKHNCFDNPWMVIGLSSTLVLILYVVRTYYVVYSYYYPHINGPSG